MHEQPPTAPSPELEQPLITHVPRGPEMDAWAKERENRLSHFQDTITPGALRAILAGSTEHAADLNQQFPVPPRPERRSVEPAVSIPEKQYIPDPSERAVRGAEMHAIKAEAKRIKEQLDRESGGA